MKKYLLLALLLTTFYSLEAGAPQKVRRARYLADCQPATSKIDMDVNNVRVRLQARNDLWWDNYRYVVPNNPLGEQVSSLFSGGIWIGGYDGAGNLKLSVTDFENTVYYPGPLNELTGTTNQNVCNNWDRHFLVYGAEISAFNIKWQEAQQNGTQIDVGDIPDNMKSYPARGNPFFSNIPTGFILPDQDLAPFFDRNNDGVYNPIDGDYPILESRNTSNPIYADLMIFSISNDYGKEALGAQGSSLGLEVQTQTFAFTTDDELNDMTFSSHKIFNRSLDTLFDTFCSIWIDGDLGCGEDDYVGCDLTRSLAYYYNADTVDGPCSVPSYKNEIPIIGIDIFCPPLGDDGKPLEMSSFVYYNRVGGNPAPTGTLDPNSGMEYYNYMSGLWRDGSPIYAGNDGYQDSQFPTTKFAFPDAPDNEAGWSMAQEGLDFGDRRTLQSFGPFTMNSGSVKELIIGFPWVPDVAHPAPSLATLLAADDKAQALFDGCFTNVNGAKTPENIELSIFPNPASNYIHIQSSENRRNVQLQLLSMSGQVMLSQKVDLSRDVSINHLPQGIYGYQVMDLKGRFLASGTLVKK